MDGSSAEKDHSRSVGKNWLMTGFCKTRSVRVKMALGYGHWWLSGSQPSSRGKAEMGKG